LSDAFSKARKAKERVERHADKLADARKRSTNPRADDVEYRSLSTRSFALRAFEKASDKDSFPGGGRCVGQRRQRRGVGRGPCRGTLPDCLPSRGE